jgi:hypothetical protein
MIKGMKVAPEIKLSNEDRRRLKEIISKGVSPARVQTRARVLLMAANHSMDSRGGERRRSNSNLIIGQELQISARTVSRIRQRFIQGGIEASLEEHPRAGRPVELDGEVEAKLVMLACSNPPDGRKRWTLQLLANRMVELKYTEHVSDTWVHQRLKKNKLHPWTVKSWVIPKVTTRFIAKMEDILEVYQRPFDPRYPVVCVDETGKELRSELKGRESIPAQPGQDARQDYAYQHQGAAYLLIINEPLRGWRKVTVHTDRTAKTFAQQLQKLVDEDYPTVEKLVLVTDNLNIHGPWSLYEAFSPEEARRIIEKIEWHYTPEHGSWLNMVEIEISALSRQCLGHRFADAESLQRSIDAWVQERNQRNVKIHWQFTNADARIHLRRLYPVLSDKI